MLTIVPDFYDAFHCMAGACPHSCCEKWEVVVDEAHAARYQQVDGPLGEKLRAALRRDAEGDACFALHGGRCPFLDAEGLCEIHRCLGPAATSLTCQVHPRFVEAYGPFQEVTLSASCPAANALLLGSDRPLTFRSEETEEETEGGDPWLAGLLPFRARMLSLLMDRTCPLPVRLGRFLCLAAEAQLCLDKDRAEDLAVLAAEWQPEAQGNAAVLPVAVWPLLSGLETLDTDWPDLLAQAAAAEGVPVPEPLLERIAVYAAFRYLLKCVNDGGLLCRAQLCVLLVLTVERLAAVCGLAEGLRRFSCEVEHSDENLNTLLEAFDWDPALNLEQFLTAPTA